jgi:endonuclease/exonuclease/phosphatase family metal-dependent hydrolase
MGDFNDEPGQRTTYCGLTHSGILQNTYDLSNGLSPKRDCPSARGRHPGFAIDQIYAGVGRGIKAKAHGWHHMAKNKPATRHGSDHTPVYDTITLQN